MDVRAKAKAERSEGERNAGIGWVGWSSSSKRSKGRKETYAKSERNERRERRPRRCKKGGSRRREEGRDESEGKRKGKETTRNASFFSVDKQRERGKC